MTFENLSGQQLGQYELRELLGTGGMAAVYLGYQINLKREVAVKVLGAQQLAEQPDYHRRFTREAETAAKLEHAHIVPIYDYGMHEGSAYVVMRLLTGGTLADRINLHVMHGIDLPSLDETARVLDQVARALDYAHRRGIIHRDIKPSNVMFDDQGAAFVVDFGIAKLLYSTSSVTGSGMTVGTPMFMAPEQWRAEELTPAADLYALGVLTYVLVTGQVPFEAPTPYALMLKHLNEAPTPPNMLRPDVPKPVAEAIVRALAKNPADRFPDVIAFAEAFAQAIRADADEMAGFFPPPFAPGELPVAEQATQAEFWPGNVAESMTSYDWSASEDEPPAAASQDDAAAAELADVALHAERSALARIRATLRRYPMAGVGALALVIGLALIGGVLLWGTGGDDHPDSGAANQAATTGTATESPMTPTVGEQTGVAVSVVSSVAPIPTAMPTKTSQPSPSANPLPTATITVFPTRTSVPTQSATRTPSPVVTVVSDSSYADPIPDFDGVIMEVTEVGGPLSVRSAAGLGSTKIDELFWGDRVLWTGETIRADGYTWYRIKLYSGRVAYIPYDADWIVSRDPARITPNIAVGKTIRITTAGNVTHLRSDPSVIDSTEVQTLYTGNTLTVIGGPTYSEYFLWWNLQLPAGRTGWAVDVPGWWQVQ